MSAPDENEGLTPAQLSRAIKAAAPILRAAVGRPGYAQVLTVEAPEGGSWGISACSVRDLGRALGVEK